MDIKEIFSISDIEDKISKLKNGRIKDLPDVTDIAKKIDPAGHDVMDVSIRPDKTIEDENGNAKTLKVCRVALPLQWLIIERAVAFIFGNEVKLKPSIDGAQVDAIMTAIKRFNKDNKIDSLNRQVARTLFTSTEVAEYWYTQSVDDVHNKYGFPSKVKLKCKVFDPLEGDELYPYFDEYGDMVAFSRAFEIKTGDTTTQFFETWTNDNYYRWKKVQDWEEDVPQLPLVIKKIPIVYATQKQPEYYKVQNLIDRLETIFSNLGDTNDYFSSPILLLNGTIESLPKKGDSGRLLQGQPDGNGNPARAEYVSWDQSPESTKMEIENLLRQIFSDTQTADISFESVKGIGSAASGTSLKLLFMDPHMKVQNEMEILDSYLTRRSNIQLAFVSAMNNKLAKTAVDLDLDNIVTPYMIGSDSDLVATLVDAKNAGIISKKTAVALNPYVENAEEELKNIEAEEQEQNSDPNELDKLQNE